MSVLLACIMQWWQCKDAGLPNALDDARDVAALRAASTEAKEAVDACLSRLRPVAHCPLLRALPGLKALHLDHPNCMLDAQQLQRCSALTRLTQLRLGGPACSQLRTHHLAWVGQLTNLQDLRVRGCAKVRLSVLACWHSLRELRALALVGLAFTAADAPHLAAFLRAGPAPCLTSLVLGDQHGLTFMSDAALAGMGGLLAGGGGGASASRCRPSSWGGGGGGLRALDLSGCIELTDAGVQQLAGLERCLTHLSLHNCMKLGGGAAATLAAFTALQALSLRGCSQLSDAQLGQLLGPLAALQQLNLQACSGLTGAFLAGVGSRLVSLHDLNLAFCAGLQTASLTHLQLLPALRRVVLAGCAAVSGEEALLLLGRLTRLTELDGGHWNCRGELTQAGASGGSSGGGSGSMSSSGSSSGTAAAAGDAAAGAQRPPDAGGEAAPSSATGAAACSASAGGSSERAVRPLLPPNLLQLKLNELSCTHGLFQALLDHLPPSLTSLDLSNCHVASQPADAAPLQRLGRLRGLQVLNLAGRSGGMLGSDLAALACLSRLRVLHMDHVHAPPAAAAAAAAPAAAAAGAGAADAAVAAAFASTAAGCGHTGSMQALDQRSSQGDGAASSSSTGTALVLGRRSGESSISTSSSSGEGGRSTSCSTCMHMYSSSGSSSSSSSSSSDGVSNSSSSSSSSSSQTPTHCWQSPAAPQGTPWEGSAAAGTTAHASPAAAAPAPHLMGVAALLLGVPAAAAAASPTDGSGHSVGGSQRRDAQQERDGYKAGPSHARTPQGRTSSAKRHLFPDAAAATAADIDALAASAAGLCITPCAQAHQQHQQHCAAQPQLLRPDGSWPGLAGLQELQVSFSPWLDDAALASLAGLTNLSSLELLANHALTGCGFRALSGLTALRALNLTGCSSLNDQGLAALAAGCGPSLRELLLPGCRAVTDEGVAALAGLTGLRVLSLSSNKSLSSRALAALFPSLRHLRSLVLALCGSLCDEGLRQLASARSLASLDLRGCWRLTDEGMHQLLSASTSLLHVNIDSCPRLSLASCPPCFVACDGIMGTSSQLKVATGLRRPGMLVRMPAA